MSKRELLIAAGAFGVAVASIGAFGCRTRSRGAGGNEPMVTQKSEPPGSDIGASAAPESSEPAGPFADARAEMVERQLRGRDITDQRVLDAMGKVPRHLFTLEKHRDRAYGDHPLPIGHGQTISQPYIVALMTQLAQTKPTSKALDVGTGSGYQAAVLAELCQSVWGIEIVEPLADSARNRLEELKYENIQVRTGDGYRGWPEHAPFDVIIVAAAPTHIPQPLVDQLAVGGRLVLPVGRFLQNLWIVEKQEDGTVRQWAVDAVRFVPMTGEAQKK